MYMALLYENITSSFFNLFFLLNYMEIKIIINVTLMRYISRLMYGIYLYLDYFRNKFK